MLSADVCILGGGMAGLTLAHQIRDRNPDLDVLVLEHRRFPAPEAAHKVGESTVEIAAHYLAEDLGFRDHLEREHLPKFGLRLFFGGATPPDDMAGFDEVGASRPLPVPTYQVDRGILENHLATTARDRGIDIRDGATVRDVELVAGDHRVTFSAGDSRQRVRSRFLVDTSGRRAWLRRGRELGRRTSHENAAVWFRVEGNVDVEQWSGDGDWLARCPDDPRRLSTNHFMGTGYWVWLIPLASGATSVGVVFDPAVVDPATVSSHERLMGWLASAQPLLAAGLADRRVLDFHVMQHYAVGARQLYCDDGWMLCGDAGVFADPFYSPGGDFIAMGNTFITELVAGGRDEPARWTEYQRHMLSFFSNTLALYRGQYPGFGHRDLMVLKSAWDYAYYWGVLAKLYFSGQLVHVDFMRRVQHDLVRAAALNAGMQKQFRAIGRQRHIQGGGGSFVDHYGIGWFHTLKNDLLAGPGDRAEETLRDNVDRLAGLAGDMGMLLPGVAAGAEMPRLDQLAALR